MWSVTDDAFKSALSLIINNDPSGTKKRYVISSMSVGCEQKFCGRSSKYVRHGETGLSFSLSVLWERS